MGNVFRRRPSPAMIVAIIALCLAIGGTAVAGGKLKLGKNAVKTKNIKNGAVTEAKIANGAISSGKLAGSAKSIWVETGISSFGVKRQSGGVTVTPNGDGVAIVDFGADVSQRAIEITPIATLGTVGVEYLRCLDISCPSGLSGSNRAIEVLTFSTSSGTLSTQGFSAAAIP